MARSALHLVFPQDLIKEPVMYIVAREYDLMLNIRRAKITSDAGEATIELEGDEDRIARAVSAFKARGVKVTSVLGDILE